MNIAKAVETVLNGKENYLVGYADMAGLLDKKYTEYKSAIVLARKLDDGIIDAIAAGPNRKYFNHYHEINRELTETGQEISAALTALPVINRLMPVSFADKELDDDYLKTLRTPFSHKMAATRAGLGWIGKTDLLVTKKFGPRVRFITILLKDKPANTGKPITKSKCGKCDLCVRACPTQAANGKLWNVNIDRNEFYNAFLCREKARSLSLEKLNEEISLCGICIAVCPVGQNK